MKKEQDSMLGTHSFTQQFLNGNETKLSNFTAYPNIKESIDIRIGSENELAASQEELKRNSAEVKNEAREAVTGWIFDTSIKICAFAHVTKNKALLIRARYNISTLKRSSDGKILLIYGTMLTCATENLENLLEYGVTQDWLAEGDGLLNTYSNEITNFKLGNVELKQLTRQLDAQIKSTEAEFKTVDAMVATLSSTDPDFYGRYMKARKRKHQAKSRISLIGKVIDSATGLPMAKAKISVRVANSTGKLLTSTPDLAKSVKKSGAKGGFLQKSLTAGTYVITATYAGYAEQEATVYINDGVLTRVEMPISKIA